MTECNAIIKANNEIDKLKRENQELKLLVQNWEALDEEKDGQLDKQNQALKKLKKENEELKQFKEKVLSLLDEEIVRNEEAIEWGEEVGADCGSMGFYNHMLKRLKKELKE